MRLKRDGTRLEPAIGYTRDWLTYTINRPNLIWLSGAWICPVEPMLIFASARLIIVCYHPKSFRHIKTYRPAEPLRNHHQICAFGRLVRIVKVSGAISRVAPGA
jgi:hypothetical protein